MEFNRSNIRFYIFARWKLGNTATSIHDDLSVVLSDSPPALSTISRWIQEFEKGRDSVKDKPRAGRKRSVVNEENAEAVRALVEADARCSISEMSDTLALSDTSIHRILHELLGYRKLCARWIPHLLNPDQKAKRVQCARDIIAMFPPNGPKRLTNVVTGDESWFSFRPRATKTQNMTWVAKGGRRSQVCRPGYSSRKRLLTVFFYFAGPVAVDVMPEGATITGTYYAQQVLPKVFRFINSQRPTVGCSRLMLLHDNASAHKTGEVGETIIKNHVTVLPHPPYSPDLAPCDFWLFREIKEKLADRKFERASDLSRAVWRELRSIPEDMYRKAFSDWLKRLQKCIDCGGEYFEGM